MSSVSWRPSPSKFEDASRHKNLTTLTTFTVSVVAPCEQKRLRSSMFLGKPPLICPRDLTALTVFVVALCERKRLGSPIFREALDFPFIETEAHTAKSSNA